MGRRKIAIEPLTDERNRSVTFLKRKAGLFKKAHELAVLCQIDIAVIIFGRNKKLYEFSSCDTDEIIEKYKISQPHESKGPSDFDANGRKRNNAAAKAAARAFNARSRAESNASDGNQDITDDEDDEEDDEEEDEEFEVDVKKEEELIVRKGSGGGGRRKSSRASPKSGVGLTTINGHQSRSGNHSRASSGQSVGHGGVSGMISGPPIGIYHSHNMESISQEEQRRQDEERERERQRIQHQQGEREQQQQRDRDLQQQRDREHREQHQQPLQQMPPQYASYNYAQPHPQQYQYSQAQHPPPQIYRRNHHRSTSSLSNNEISAGSISAYTGGPPAPNGPGSEYTGSPSFIHHEDQQQQQQHHQQQQHQQQQQQQQLQQHQQHQQHQQQQHHQQQQQQQQNDINQRRATDWQMFGVIQPRSQSVDIDRRYYQDSPQPNNNYSPSGSVSGSVSGPTNNMRPKLKVQIPMGDSAESQISSSEPSRDGKDRTVTDDDSNNNKNNNGRIGNAANQSTSISTNNITVSNNSRSGTISRTTPGPKEGASSGSGLQSTPLSNRDGPISAGPNSAGGGTGSGGPWGSSLLLPPPSPSSYLSNNGGPNSSTVGPGNPFGRPPLVSNNGEQTPLSAALPSKYVNDLLPSPSNFYGSEWNAHFGPPSALGYGGSSGLPLSGGLGSAFPGQNSLQPNSSSSSSNNSQSQPQQPPVGIGISLGGLLGSRSHLSSDMLPSPLQFNTPVVASSSQSLGDIRGSPTDKKRDGGNDLSAGPSKRIKVDNSGPR